MRKFCCAAALWVFGYLPYAHGAANDSASRTRTAPEATTSESTDSARHSLWSIQGRTNTVYLLGSIHFLSPREDFPPAIDTAYRDAEALVMEIDMDDLDPLEAQQLTIQLGMLPQGKSLEQLIGAERYRHVVAKADALGLEESMLKRMRPWLAALTLVQLHLTSMGLEASAGVEHQLLALAKSDGKPITGLETLEQQLTLLAGLPDQAQADFLLYSIQDAERARQQVDALLSAWRKGDTQALEAFLVDELERHPALYRPLTVDRNHRWVPDLEALLDDEADYLVVVGTLHLVGKESVIELLEKRGHKVRQH